MNKRIGITILVVVVIGLGLWLVLSSPTYAPAPVDTASTSTGTNDQPNDNGISLSVSSTVTLDTVREIMVTGNKFSFTPSTITVEKGTVVKLTFKNIEGFHDLKLDEFNVATPQINGGEEATVTFTADKAGSFEYYCSVGNHRAMGMVGMLTVTE